VLAGAVILEVFETVPSSREIREKEGHARTWGLHRARGGTRRGAPSERLGRCACGDGGGQTVGLREHREVKVQPLVIVSS